MPLSSYGTRAAVNARRQPLPRHPPVDRGSPLDLWETGSVKNRVIAVVGPTAAGKSDLGVALARILGGEVINADSMQLYRGMDIGTAKLPVPQRRGVAHHLLDVLEVGDEATLAAYQRAAEGALEDV